MFGFLNSKPLSLKPVRGRDPDTGQRTTGMNPSTKPSEEPRLRADALGFGESVVMGVAGIGPAYSLAATAAVLIGSVGVTRGYGDSGVTVTVYWTPETTVGGRASRVERSAG